MDSEKPRNGFFNVSIAAATLVLSAGWSAAVQGAANSDVGCDGEMQELSTLNISSKALVANKVDHPTSASGPASLDTVESDSDVSDASAPLLYLTPRVANLLRDVFQSPDDEDPQAVIDESPSSPVAESLIDQSEPKNTMEHGDDISPAVGVDKEILPRFQQQMYRKDI